LAGLRFADLQSRPTEFLDVTSVTLDEFQQLVPPFEAVFQAHLAAWRLDGVSGDLKLLSNEQVDQTTRTWLDRRSDDPAIACPSS
jgi:hypothetical protein